MRKSSHVHIENIKSDEFDYLIYFEDVPEDEYYYCFKDMNKKSQRIAVERKIAAVYLHSSKINMMQVQVIHHCYQQI